MTKSLELSDKEHKINIIKMIRTLSKKVDSVQEQMENVNKYRNFKKILEIQSTIMETINAFSWLIRRLDTPEEEIRKYEDMSL